MYSFEITPKTVWNALHEPTMLWAVSQSCPLRRVSIKGGLSLYQYTGGDAAGYASGGFIGDIDVETTIYGGSQQQFCVRNVNVGNNFTNGAWNIIFVGSKFTKLTNIPKNGDECHPYTYVEKTPVVAEKPYIYLNTTTTNNGSYSLIVPRVEMDKIGGATNWGSDYDIIDFGYVYVTHTDSNYSIENYMFNTSNIVNEKLEEGYHILFGPGIYNITDSMIIRKNNTIITGIGFPTLECGHYTGDPCFIIPDGVTGVRITGVLLQAGPHEYYTSTLLQVGNYTNSSSTNNNNTNNKKTDKYLKYKQRLANRLAKEYGIGHTVEITKTGTAATTAAPDNDDSNDEDDSILTDHSNIESTKYNFIIDVFARVGGMNNVSLSQAYAKEMFSIYSNDVVIDNTWLWRADHDISGLVSGGDNRCETGATINGDSVIAYGLKVEHTLEDMVEWNGNDGKVYFFQSELPYDVTEDYGVHGYTAYRLGNSVINHEMHGVGVYCYFRDYNVTVNSGFVIGNESRNVNITHPLTVHLNGNGGIEHVVNDQGMAVNSTNMYSYLCSYTQ